MNSVEPLQWHEAMKAQGLNVCALVDGSAGSVSQQRWNTLQAIHLFDTLTADPEALRIAPRLYSPAQGADQERRLVSRYTDQSAEQPFVTLIATALETHVLAVRLTRRMHVDAAGLPMMLRLWDPRTLRVLPLSLKPDTQSALLGFGAEALVADRSGGHGAIDLTCPEQDPLENDKLRLAQHELDALQNAAYPDALLGALRAQDEALLNTVPDETRHALALSQWHACERHGISQVQDQVLALSLAIEHGNDWWTQPRWAACVQQATGGSLLKAYQSMLRASS